MTESLTWRAVRLSKDRFMLEIFCCIADSDSVLPTFFRLNLAARAY